MDGWVGSNSGKMFSFHFVTRTKERATLTHDFRKKREMLIKHNLFLKM